MAVEKIKLSAWPRDDAWMPAIWSTGWVGVSYWVIGFFAGIAAMAMYYIPIYLVFDVFGVAENRPQMHGWRWSYFMATLETVYAYPMIILSVVCVWYALWGNAVIHPLDSAVSQKEGGLLGRVTRGVSIDENIVCPSDESRGLLIRAKKAIHIGFLPWAFALSWTYGVWKFNKKLAVIVTVIMAIVGTASDMWILELFGLVCCFALLTNGLVKYWAEWLREHKAIEKEHEPEPPASEDAVDEIQYRR